MWPAATAEDWAKPCLIPWQRSFDDALEVSQATGAPILVCVNMDGEIASEHYAGVRYRDPATATALERYVCVIASVYRHTPRDYDEQGQRVLCPRFGTVTCGEHIASEVELYEKYFEGKRISPRHIMLDLEGAKSYDVYYSWDTATVFTAFAKGVENLPLPTPRLRDGWTIADRVASADAADRAKLEIEYRTGTPARRVEILRAVLAERRADQDDVLRLAIFGLDLECAKLARQALAQSESEGSIELIAEALKVPLEAGERDALVAAAERLAEQYPRARTLVALHQGLSMDSSQIPAGGGADPGASAAEYAASVQQRADAAADRPGDAALKLELAESLLARANEDPGDPRWTQIWLKDARTNAEEAARLGAGGWRLDATLAVILDQLGEAQLAREHAVKAVEGGMWSLSAADDPATDLVQARALALFAQARQLAIREAYRERTKWPAEWLADVNAAYAKLAEHPLVTEDNLVSFYDFLYWLGGTRRARAVLDDALAKFPDSALLHDRLRAHVLWDQGPSELQGEYTERLAQPGHSPPADLVRRLRLARGRRELPPAERARQRPGGLPARHRALRAQPGRRARGPRLVRSLHRPGPRRSRAHRPGARRPRRRDPAAAGRLRAPRFVDRHHGRTGHHPRDDGVDAGGAPRGGWRDGALAAPRGGDGRDRPGALRGTGLRQAAGRPVGREHAWMRAAG